jgi:primosomal protein N' (replication factor Y)
VAGRAGRGTEPGRVLVQAFRPEAISADWAVFSREELHRREALHFPPFSRLTALRLQGNSETAVRGTAERAAAMARRLVSAGEAADVLGPAPAPLAKVRGKHRWQILLRARDHGPLHRIARHLQRSHDVRGVELAVDVDPVALL